MINVAMKKRISFIFGFTVFIILLLLVRVFWIQVIQGEELQGKAINNRMQAVEINPKRGVIYDSGGNPLAISVSMGSVSAVPAEVNGKKNIEKTARELSKILQIDQKEIKDKLATDLAFTWIKRKVPDKKIKKIEKLELPGIKVIDENHRSYPKGKTAAHVVGFAGIDNQGLNGLELRYDSVLKGIPGKIMIEQDVKHREIPNSIHEYINPTDGHSLYLTIDESIQYIVEREIEKAIEATQAKAIGIIVMDIKTGSILSLANRPVFDPNNYEQYDKSTWRNFVISDAYEPGSTFKPVTAAAVLEEQTINKNDRFQCPGYILIGKERINCWKLDGHGTQSFAEGVQNSCNPVFASAALKLGKEDFYKYLEGFEFGKKTGIELPGEATGILVPQSRVKDIDIGSMSMGQANAVTAIQLIRAISAIANDGWLMEPRLVKEIRDYEGNLIKEINPKPIQQVISKETSSELSEILESVVSEGTGQNAQVEGYQIAGKTGTAQKILPGGGYSKSSYIASFVGYAPANDPEIACLVVVDSPRGGYFGGQVAAPIFQSIMKDALRYLKIPPEAANEDAKTAKVEVPNVENLKTQEAVDKITRAGFEYQQIGEGEEVLLTLPLAGTKVDKASNIIIYTEDKSSNMVVVPDLKGMTIREVSSILSKLDLKTAAQGNGLASLQDPLPGTEVAKGTPITITFKSLNQEKEEETMGP